MWQLEAVVAPVKRTLCGIRHERGNYQPMADNVIEPKPFVGTLNNCSHASAIRP